MGRGPDAPRCLGRHLSNNLTLPVIAQLESARACKQLVERYEEAEGVRFEGMGHVRPDAKWIRPAPPVQAWPDGSALLTSSKWAPSQDWAVFGSRAPMLQWFGRLDYVRRACARGAS